MCFAILRQCCLFDSDEQSASELWSILFKKRLNVRGRGYLWTSYVSPAVILDSQIKTESKKTRFVTLKCDFWTLITFFKDSPRTPTASVQTAPASSGRFTQFTDWWSDCVDKVKMFEVSRPYVIDLCWFNSWKLIVCLDPDQFSVSVRF